MKQLLASKELTRQVFSISPSFIFLATEAETISICSREQLDKQIPENQRDQVKFDCKATFKFEVLNISINSINERYACIAGLKDLVVISLDKKGGIITIQDQFTINNLLPDDRIFIKKIEWVPNCQVIALIFDVT